VSGFGGGRGKRCRKMGECSDRCDLRRAGYLELIVV
jgi:hypothetical protein